MKWPLHGRLIQPDSASRLFNKQVIFYSGARGTFAESLFGMPGTPTGAALGPQCLTVSSGNYWTASATRPKWTGSTISVVVAGRIQEGSSAVTRTILATSGDKLVEFGVGLGAGLFNVTPNLYIAGALRNGVNLSLPFVQGDRFFAATTFNQPAMTTYVGINDSNLKTASPASFGAPMDDQGGALIFGKNSGGTQYFIGDIDYCLVTDVCLTEEQLYDLRTNPEILFAPRPVAVLYSAAGGPSTWTYTPTGGMTFAGSAALAKQKVHAATGGITLGGSAGMAKTKVWTATGGLTFAGTAPRAKTKTYAPSGGLSFAGSAARLKIKVFTPAGGLAFAGAAALTKIKVYLPSGGIVFAGAAATSFTGAGVWTYTGSGGLTFAGSAALLKVKAYTPSGGVVFAGAAATSYTAPGATTYTYVGAGLLEFAGSATLAKIKDYLPSGGIVFSGAAQTISPTAPGIYDVPQFSETVRAAPDRIGSGTIRVISRRIGARSGTKHRPG